MVCMWFPEDNLRKFVFLFSFHPYRSQGSRFERSRLGDPGLEAGTLTRRAVSPVLAFLSVWVSKEKRNEHLQPLELQVSVFVALTGPWI